MSKRNRGLIIIPHDFQGHYTMGFVKGLAKNKVDFVLVTSFRASEMLDKNIDTVHLIRSNDSSRKIIVKIIDYLFYQLRLMLYIFRNRNSVVHLVGFIKYPVIQGLFQNILIRMISKKLVMTVHNLLPHDDHTFLKKIVFRYIYKVPNILIVHTEKMKMQLVENFKVKNSKIILMEHGKNDCIQRVAESKEESMRELGIRKDKLVLLAFGTISPYKGIDKLIQAFSYLDGQYQLVIVGKAIDKIFSNKLQKMCIRNSNAENIIFLDKFISDELVAKYFNAADVCVMPYDHIDQSGVLFLALSMGLPTIAFNVGMFAQYIGRNNGIICNNNTIEGLVIAVEQFEKTKNDFSREAIINYSKKFQWENVVKTILRIYE